MLMRVVPLDRELEVHEAGFDYAQAVREINHAGWSYARIAQYCGYESRQSIQNIVGGAMPPHVQGERLYILYVEMFQRKPPVRTVKVGGQTATT